MMRVHAVLCLVLAAAVAQVGAIGPSRELLGKDVHKFNRGTVIPMFANKIGPFHNPRCELCSPPACALKPRCNLGASLWRHGLGTAARARRQCAKCI